MKQVYDPTKVGELDQEKMQDYLDLADFIMNEANSSCNGIWLKGSTGYHEKAI